MVSREDKIKNYHLEFDGLVEACNGWLVSQFQQTIPSVLECRHPLDSRDDLTSTQKEIVVSASDYKRIESKLEQLVIFEGDTSAGETIKALAQQRYEHLRDSYVSCALKAEKIN